MKNVALSFSSNSEVLRSAVCFRAQEVNTFWAAIKGVFQATNTERFA